MTPRNGIRYLLPGPVGLAALRRIGRAVIVCLSGALFASPGLAAEDLSREQMKGLDEQVQEIKTDVLGIAAELNGLEERLLFPSNTQVAIFVALAEGEAFRLDAVQVQINGSPVAHHIYSFKELEALQMGGVQRIYTGNIPTGDHQLDVTVAGKLESGKEFSETANFGFHKAVEPKLVGITFADMSAGSSGIQLGEW